MRARRVDDNQKEIVKALRAVGAFVWPIHTLGRGCPDLLVFARKNWTVLEVKDGKKKPSAQKLTASEQRWHALAGLGAVRIVKNIDEALAAIA